MTTNDAAIIRKELYPLSELVRLFGLHRNKLARLLETNGVEFTRVGTARYVNEGQLWEKIPTVWGRVLERAERDGLLERQAG